MTRMGEASTLTAEQIAHKLRLIAGLTAAEVHGWRFWLGRDREPFPGEIAALAERERELNPKINLKHKGR